MVLSLIKSQTNTNMLLVRAFWFGILLSEIDNVVGYYSYRLLRDFSSKSTPLQLNCSYGVPIPPSTIDKSFTRDEEKQVLKRFYNETSGYNWTIQRPGWTPYDNGTEIDHCHWAGVTCDKKSGYVIGLCLNKNNLHGRVPNFLWKLRNLMLLCLPDNPSLEGELKDFVFQNMSKLLRIDLAFCSLSGNLPNDLFSSLKSLVKIQLCCQISKTKIYGSIPQSITDLKELRVLSIGENGLSGPIPQTMGKLTKVWFLDLEFMPSLSGNINDFFGMKSLIYMHLTHAGIYGEFPDNFGSYFPQMKECQLGNNSIHSFIPPSVNRMKNLTKLILRGNGLRGKIPKELGELPSLRILDLSYNPHLQGMEVELNFHDSTKLEIFVLRNNPSITMLFEDLVSKLVPKPDLEQNPSPLRVLDISYCDFTGTISPMIWTFSNLIELNLKHNRISGRIPAVLDDLMFLSYADFSENPKLKGAIPNDVVLLQSLRVFDISGNPLMTAPVGSINQTNGIIQKIMRIDPNSRIKRDNYNCPLVKLLSNDGRILLDPGYYYKKFCVCEDGFFGYLGHCKQCISGGSCSSKALQSTDPRISLDIQKGYWPSPSPDNVLHLIRCPGRLDIAGEHLACNPKGECKCWVNTSTPDRRTVCDTSCICHAGNTGRVCSKCAKNYFKNGYLCTECFKPSLSCFVLVPFYIIFLLALWGLTKFFPEHIKVKISIAVTEFIILLTLRAFEVISGWIFEVSVLVVVFYVVGIMKNTRAIVTMLVFHFQVLDAIISETETPFPPFVYSIQHYMSSIFNLNFLGISCSIHMLFTPLGKYLVVFLFPLGCLSLIWIYYGIRWAFTTILCRSGEQTEQQPPALEQIRFQCLKVSITCLILTYFPVMKHTLAVISPCEYDQDTAGSFMRYTQWIRCDTSDSTYETLQVLGCMAIIIYGVFEPLALLKLLRRWKKSPLEKKKYFDSWLGSIYLPYKDEVREYFEVLKLYRKFLIAFLLTFIPNTTSIQTFTIAFVLMIAVIYQIIVEPYAEAKDKNYNFENVLEALSLITLQQSVILLRFASYDSEMSYGMILIVLVVNAFVLIAFMVAWVLIEVYSASNDESSNGSGDPQPQVCPAGIPPNDERSPLLQSNRSGNPQHQYSSI